MSDANSSAHQRVRASIRALLKDRGMSAAELARGVRCTPAWASMYLSGKRDIPLKRLERVAEFFGKPVEALVATPGYTDHFVVANTPARGKNLPIY